MHRQFKGDPDFWMVSEMPGLAGLVRDLFLELLKHVIAKEFKPCKQLSRRRTSPKRRH
jgi:hypothetical protein